VLCHVLTSSERCPDEADGELCPNDEEREQNSRADGDAIPGAPYFPQHKLARETGAEQQNAGGDEIDRGPGKLRYYREEQQQSYRDKNADESFVFHNQKYCVSQLVSVART
jgi:hypothetical protein